MLEKRRIEEAERNVRDYLRTAMLRKEPFREHIFKILQRNAAESIETAELLREQKKSDLWIIVTSYYAMFYIANAALCRFGYKVGDKIPHKITADALIVFVRNKLKHSMIEEYEVAQSEALAGIKADNLLESYDNERIKRGRIQYETTDEIKHAKALTSLARAKAFLFDIEKLLSNRKERT